MANDNGKKKNGNSKNGTAIMGRPTRYRVAFNELVYKLCLLNAIDTQIADVLGISERTLDVWKNKYPDFMQSIKKGKIQADAEVAKALFHRATGYEHKETKVFCQDGKIIEREVTKHYPPDTGAAFIWLKNRSNWKDEQGHNLNIKIYTDEEREALRKKLASRCINVTSSA
jgi:hypothetical protein